MIYSTGPVNRYNGPFLNLSNGHGEQLEKVQKNNI